MKRKSIYKISINLWKRKFKQYCDSKINPWWRKRDLKGFVRDMGITTANIMVYDLGREIARREFFGGDIGWTVEFENFYTENQEHFDELALDVIYAQTHQELVEALKDAMDAELEAMWS